MDWVEGREHAVALDDELSQCQRSTTGYGSEPEALAHIQTMTGGLLEVSVKAVPERLSHDGRPLLLVTFLNDSAGPALGFWRARLSAEVGVDLTADWSLARRRAARGLIAFGLKTANALESGKLRPDLRPSPSPFTGYEMEYGNRLVVAGLARTARVDRHVDDGGRQSKYSRQMPREASEALRRLTRELHGSVDLENNRALFGQA